MTKTLTHHNITPDRKHYTQLTKEEVTRIQNRYREVTRNLTVCDHAYDQMAAKGIARTDLTFRGRLIEFCRCGNDSRILLRQDNGVCLVISLSNARLITVFKNNGTDNHKTLDWSQYKGTAEVRW